MLARLDVKGANARVPALPRLGLSIEAIPGHLRMFLGLPLDAGLRLWWAEPCDAFWAGPVAISISKPVILEYVERV
jgi:hypothetical protein